MLPDSDAAGIAFDVIHAHDWLTFRAALRVKQQTNLPWSLHVHTIGEIVLVVRLVIPWFVNRGARLPMADHIIAVSQYTKDMIIADYQIPADKIQVAHNSIDKQAFEPLDKDNTHHYLSALKTQGYRVVANVGRLTLQKNSLISPLCRQRSPG